MKKTVDVIIPAYNAGKFIERTLQSVVSQTHLPEKIIIVDDGSTDETVDIIENFKKNSLVRIDLYKQENRGPNAARNVGLKHSTSEFVAFLDADDLWEKEKLEKQLEVFEKSEFKNLGFVYCAHGLINSNDEEIRACGRLFVPKPYLRGMVFENMFDGMKAGPPSAALIRRDCFEKAGCFDESLRGAEDWDMWIRITEYHCIDYAKDKLCSIRLHDSNAHNNSLFMMNETIKLTKKWACILPENHPGIEKLGTKSFDYFFVSICKLNISFSKELYRLFDKVLSKDEKKVIYKNAHGCLWLAAVFRFPRFLFSRFKRCF